MGLALNTWWEEDERAAYSWLLHDSLGPVLHSKTSKSHEHPHGMLCPCSLCGSHGDVACEPGLVQQDLGQAVPQQPCSWQVLHLQLGMQHGGHPSLNLCMITNCVCLSPVTHSFTICRHCSWKTQDDTLGHDTPLWQQSYLYHVEWRWGFGRHYLHLFLCASQDQFYRRCADTCVAGAASEALWWGAAGCTLVLSGVGVRVSWGEQGAEAAGGRAAGSGQPLHKATPA